MPRVYNVHKWNIWIPLAHSPIHRNESTFAVPSRLQASNMIRQSLNVTSVRANCIALWIRVGFDSYREWMRGEEGERETERGERKKKVDWLTSIKLPFRIDIVFPTTWAFLLLFFPNGNRSVPRQEKMYSSISISIWMRRMRRGKSIGNALANCMTKCAGIECCWTSISCNKYRFPCSIFIVFRKPFFFCFQFRKTNPLAEWMVSDGSAQCARIERIYYL